MQKILRSGVVLKQSGRQIEQIGHENNHIAVLSYANESCV